jgi:hypothetical protein
MYVWNNKNSKTSKPASVKPVGMGLKTGPVAKPELWRPRIIDIGNGIANQCM